MHRVTVFITLLVACLFISGTSLPDKATAQAASLPAVDLTTTEAALVNITPMQLPVTEEPAPAVEDLQHAALTDYYEAAMNFWVKPTSLSTDYHAVASDMATVCLNEEPIWSNDTTRARTGIQMLALAFHESSYRAYVDDGTCNKYTKEHAPKDVARLFALFGDCDGGEAHSMWQVWPKQMLDSNGKLVEFTARDLDSDRKNAIRAALFIARRSIRGSGGLCWYSGEGSGGDCPKAAVRYETAQDYYKHHPFTPPHLAD
jgi:hypothetical protein